MYTINKSRISNLESQISERNNGQTMLEIIVALALLILFLTGIVLVELFAIRNIEYAQNKSTATRLARQQLDRARIVRDSAGMSALSTNCLLSACYINSLLTPVPVTPTGTYGQTLKVQETTSLDCPLPEITPTPVSYKATAVVSWAKGVTGLTPAPQVEMSSCLTDWR